MQDMEAEHSFGRPQDWPSLHFVPVDGVREGEVAWDTVAVLEASPPDSDFLIAFKNGANGQRCRVRVTTAGGRFGMRVGDDDVEFCALPINPNAEVKLTLVARTYENDSRFPDLPLY